MYSTYPHMRENDTYENHIFYKEDLFSSEFI